MHKRILIPLDGSKLGESALLYVEQLISKLSPEVKTEVTLLQVLSQLTHPLVAGESVINVPYNDHEIEQAKTTVTDYLDAAGESLKSKGVTVMARVAIGDTSEEIGKIAEEISADLIAMSTHGRSGLSRWAFGSITDKVLRQGGQAPILMVKATSPKK